MAYKMNEYIVNRGNTYVYALSKETLAGKAKKNPEISVLRELFIPHSPKVQFARLKWRSFRNLVDGGSNILNLRLLGTWYV
jgi:hypothetical protein